MRQEAEVFAEEDRKRKEFVELKNQAENLLFSYESTLKDNSGLISEQIKTLANEKVVQLREAIAHFAKPTHELKQLVEEFQQTLFAIGADVYNRANSQTDENHQVEDHGDISVTPDLNPSTSGTLIPQFNFDFDEESTAQADYEAID